MKIFVTLLRLLYPYRYVVGLSTLLGFLTVGSSIGLLMSSAFIIAKAALHPSIAELQVAIVGVRFFGLSRGIFRYLERLFSHQATLKLLQNLRVWIYRALEPLSPRLLRQLKRGELLQQAISDIEQLEHFYIRVLSPPVLAAAVLVLMTFLLSPYGSIFPVLLWMAFLLGGFGLPVATYFIDRKYAPVRDSTQRRFQQLNIDFVQGIAELIMANRERDFVYELSTTGGKILEHKYCQATRSGAQEAGLQFLLTITVALQSYLALPLVAAGEMSGISLTVMILGTMAAFEVLPPLAGASQYLFEIHQAGSRILGTLEQTRSDAGQKRYSLRKATLSVQKVTFRYQADLPPVLQDISFELEPGKKVAILGHSGSGKSTLVSLLVGFESPIEGKIKLGSQDLQAIDPDDRFAMFSVLQQEPFLFHDTIRNNLRVADPTFDEGKALQLIDAVGLGDWFSQLPLGFDTVIGELGQRLSGGQRQRLALVRTLLKSAPYILLDEPTNHVDPASEARILETVLQQSREKGLLWISHRLKGLHLFDEILVLEKGRIIERGSFPELEKNKGPFRQLLLLWRHNLTTT